MDATRIRDYLMLNTTDSVYSRVIPVEYPKVGESPSPTRIGVVSVTGGPTVWLAIPGDPQQHYLNRMDWIPNSSSLFVQQLNRKQNESKLLICTPATQSITPIYTETDKAWVDVRERNTTDPNGGEWLSGGKAFVWVSEKDGWRHIYR
ncbi:DPP IV N-terminal domain-containing protein [Spirosoma telluris]|uniref:DPP IV N-terminal domain-containing protein n=1 Tax=Spirosoma telluris TaxID=2183553 RepID=UPI0038CDACB4